jgi:hypothetical protein
LALQERDLNPTFLWAVRKKTGIEQWPSSRLTAILKERFREQLGAEVRILTWRHAAIAISRRHTKQHKFRRDYGASDGRTWNDEQASHPSHVAGSIYARGIEEAPGHIASARAEYRQISRAWHDLLGVAGPAPASQQPTSNDQALTHLKSAQQPRSARDQIRGDSVALHDQSDIDSEEDSEGFESESDDDTPPLSNGTSPTRSPSPRAQAKVSSQPRKRKLGSTSNLYAEEEEAPQAYHRTDQWLSQDGNSTDAWSAGEESGREETEKRVRSRGGLLTKRQRIEYEQRWIGRDYIVLV